MSQFPGSVQGGSPWVSKIFEEGGLVLKAGEFR